MTYRSSTEEDRDEYQSLLDALSDAEQKLSGWKKDDLIRRSSLQVGDLAYDLRTGRLVGRIHALLSGDYYSWQVLSSTNEEQCNVIDNNSRTYGVPELGTKDEAIASLRQEMKSMEGRIKNMQD